MARGQAAATGGGALLVYIFRRDLRVVDSLALDALCSRAPEGAALLPLFIVDPDQADPASNPYHCTRAAAFLTACLQSLDAEGLQGKLQVLRMPPGGSDALLDAVSVCARGSRKHIVAVGFNVDVTPYARARDERIRAWCLRNGVECVDPGCDYSLVEPAAMPRPYQVFTPFYRRYTSASASASADGARAQRPSVLPPARLPTLLLAADACRPPHRVGSWAQVADMLHAGAAESSDGAGRGAGLALLARVASGQFSGYARTRDAPALEAGTTRMGALLKFGCVSVREALAACVSSGSEELVRQLYWRAFYDQVAWHFPRVLAGMAGARQNGSLRATYDAVPWAPTSMGLMDAWRAGRTGFPFVDAGMRQLASTGWMHNRARMVAASVLVKDFGVDWREGERYFATQLLDYHPPANSGGWQWVAGGGADAQPYIRVFSPWLQARRFDPECQYVRAWVPELRAVPVADILAWDVEKAARHAQATRGYPPPLVEHSAAARGHVDRVRRALHQ